MKGSNLTHGFYISNDSTLNILDRNETSSVLRWESVRYHQIRPALLLSVGQKLVLPKIKIDEDYDFFLAFGLSSPTLPGKDMEMTISFLKTMGEQENRVISFVFLKNENTKSLKNSKFSIGHLADQHGCFCLQFGENKSDNFDTNHYFLVISELVIGSSDKVDLLRAKAYKSLRIKYEMDHFKNVYKSLFYASRRKVDKNVVKLSGPTYYKQAKRKKINLSDIKPKDGENAYLYASRLLGVACDYDRPNFSERLMHFASNEAVDMISFCSGTATVEKNIIRQSGRKTNLTIIELSHHFFENIQKNCPKNCRMQLNIQDVNVINIPKNHYDIAVFVSGAHHCVELEHIWLQIRNALKPGGELWLIGEQVGKNGSMLYKNDYSEANRVFKSLPKKYRTNSFTKKYESELSNKDCSEATFEGIRSQNIEITLGKHFLPVHIYKRNCFLWLLTNQTYSDNYDLTNKKDIKMIQYIVKKEISFFKSGLGYPTELHGIYKPMHLKEI